MNLKLIFLAFSTLIIASCSEHIVSECEPIDEGEPAMAATFSAINEEVLQPSCALSGCHINAFLPELSEPVAYENLVNKQNNARNMNYVEPGDAANSFLIKKLLGDGTTLMPQGGPKLDDEVIDSIKVWINNGALNN
ncbi:MAG: hypothetical protein ACE364_10295 [Chlorobiota bacterium]